MTENLLQKLEEKTMILLSEVEELRSRVLEIEELRKQIQFLNQENTSLKMEKETHSNKLQDLIGLLDSVQTQDQASILSNAQMTKPMLVQG